MKLRTKLALALTLLIAFAIAYGTLRPLGGNTGLPFTDKQLHFMAFACLALPIGWVRPAWALWLIPLSLAYGALIEVAQPFIGRSGDIWDLVADGLGILAGVLPGQIRHSLKKRM
jgi:VanZ family protein